MEKPPGGTGLLLTALREEPPEGTGIAGTVLDVRRPACQAGRRASVGPAALRSRVSQEVAHSYAICECGGFNMPGICRPSRPRAGLSHPENQRETPWTLHGVGGSAFTSFLASRAAS